MTAPGAPGRAAALRIIGSKALRTATATPAVSLTPFSMSSASTDSAGRIRSKASTPSAIALTMPESERLNPSETNASPGECSGNRNESDAVTLRTKGVKDVESVGSRTRTLIHPRPSFSKPLTEDVRLTDASTTKPFRAKSLAIVAPGVPGSAPSTSTASSRPDPSAVLRGLGGGGSRGRIAVGRVDRKEGCANSRRKV